MPNTKIPTKRYKQASVTADVIQDLTIKNADVASDAALSATKIADGTVTDSEFQTLKTSREDLQVQIDRLGSSTEAAAEALREEFMQSARLTGVDTQSILGLWPLLDFLVTGITANAAPDFVSGKVGVYRISFWQSIGAASGSIQTKNTLSLGAWEYTQTTSTAINALSDATNSYTIRLGLSSADFNADPSSGVFFRYTHSVASGHWQCVARTSGVETSVDTNVFPSVTPSFQPMKIVVSSWVASFYISWVLVGTISTNVPWTTVPLKVWLGMVKNAGTTTRYLQVDYILAKFVLTALR